jgi:hypothetical protein
MTTRQEILRDAGRWALRKHLPLSSLASLLDEIDRALEWDFELRQKYEERREWGTAEVPFIGSGQ